MSCAICKGPCSSSVIEEVHGFLTRVGRVVAEKNQSYGNSALDPIRIFAHSDKLEQLKVRIDDKLSRIARGSELLDKDDDIIVDLVGYLALLYAGKKREETNAGDDVREGKNVANDRSVEKNNEGRSNSPVWTSGKRPSSNF